MVYAIGEIILVVIGILIALQNIVIELIYLSKGKDSIYNQALNEVNTIIEMIDDELIDQ